MCKYVCTHLYKIYKYTYLLKKEALNLKITMGIHMVWWRERKERNDVSKQRKIEGLFLRKRRIFSIM